MQTEDGNEIDTIFVDRRNDAKFPNGNILVSWHTVCAVVIVYSMYINVELELNLLS